MNNLVKLPELQHDMQELSMEFMKAGIMDEMVQDALEMDDDELEEEADEEVDKVLMEVTQGIKVYFNSCVGIIGTSIAPVGGLEVDEEQVEEEKALESRMKALASI